MQTAPENRNEYNLNPLTRIHCIIGIMPCTMPGSQVHVQWQPATQSQAHSWLPESLGCLSVVTIASTAAPRGHCNTVPTHHPQPGMACQLLAVFKRQSVSTTRTLKHMSIHRDTVVPCRTCCLRLAGWTVPTNRRLHKRQRQIST
jgi:hypothetical protein